MLTLLVVEFIPLEEQVLGFINILEFISSYLTSINELVPIPTVPMPVTWKVFVVPVDTNLLIN